jgi:hypothetical protein
MKKPSFINLFYSPVVVSVTAAKNMVIDGARSAWGEMRDAYKILVGKSEAMIPLGSDRLGWKNNI